MVGKSSNGSSNSGGGVVNNNNNVYDIICYYKEDEQDNENQVQHVIDSIERAESEQEAKGRKYEVIRKASGRKCIKWKLLACLLMSVLLSSPIYSYVAIYLHHKTKFDANIALIWTPIIFNAVYLLVTPWLFNSLLSPSSSPPSLSSSSPSPTSLLRLTNRNVIIASTLVLSASVSFAGFTFAYLDANFFLIALLYGVIGGMSSCVILGRVFVVVSGILNNERLHLINFIYSFSGAVTQFVYPLMIHFVIQLVCYNCTMLVVGALLLHIIPIAMLVVNDRDLKIASRQGEGEGESRLKRKKRRKSPIDLMRRSDESRYGDIASASYDFYPDIKYPSDVLDATVKWNNPCNHIKSDEDDQTNDDHFLEILDSHRVMNSDGVEILETIEEVDDDDGEELKFSEEVTIDNVEASRRAGGEEEEFADGTVDSIYEEINRKYELQQHQQQLLWRRKWDFIKSFVTHKYESAFTMLYRQVLNPLRRSLKIFRFYPAVILKSIDVFSYLLYSTLIMPNQAVRQYQFDERESVVYLIALMGFCWIIYSVAVLRLHTSLKQNCIHYYHLIGLLAKFFGYLFTNQKYSLNGFLFGILLISFGHANSFHLQETVIRNCFHPRKWYYLRGPIYSFSGFLILIYCIIFHILHAYLSFVTFTNIFVLFNLCCIVVWLLTNYEMIIYVCSRY